MVATNENLAANVREGMFREDLYMRLNPATAVTLPSLRDRKDDFQHLLETFTERVCASGYNRDLLLQYAAQRGLHVPEEGEPFTITVGRKVPAKADPRRIHFLLHPSSFKLLRNFDWPGNFRQFEMLLSNLVTFTLVELVDRADQVEPGAETSRADVVPIQPRTVSELLRPWDDLGNEEDDEGGSNPDAIEINLEAAESLNAVSQDVERQYLERLYRRHGGDLGKIAEILLGDASAGRKVQLRMNQLGMKLRELKRARTG